ncbi:hypothetical protein ACP4OV_001408 [Aristida adscensionis]
MPIKLKQSDINLFRAIRPNARKEGDVAICRFQAHIYADITLASQPEQSITPAAAMEEHHIDSRKISKEDDDAVVKPAKSFRYEDYSTRRVFLRSYPLQWDWSPEPDDKHGRGGSSAPEATKKRAYGDDDDYDGSDDHGDERGSKGHWKRQVVVAVVEWGEEKLLLLRRAKKRLALYLLGCHYGRPALPYRSGGSCTAAMLTSR